MNANYEGTYIYYKEQWQEATIGEAALRLTGAVNTIINSNRYTNEEKVGIIRQIEKVFYEKYM